MITMEGMMVTMKVLASQNACSLERHHYDYNTNDGNDNNITWIEGQVEVLSWNIDLKLWPFFRIVCLVDVEHCSHTT